MFNINLISELTTKQQENVFACIKFFVRDLLNVLFVYCKQENTQEKEMGETLHRKRSD